MKKLLLFSAAIIFSNLSFAQSQGPNNPGTAVDPAAACLSCPGTIWNNPGNVMFSDGMYAMTVLNPNTSPCGPTPSCWFSRYIFASSFGFTIPAGATILGVVAETQRSPGNPNTVRDSTIRLGKASLPVGANRANPNPWPNIMTYGIYGNATDMWGTTWTPAEINAPGFGLFFKIFNVTSTITATVIVDHMRITVYYSTPAGIFSQTMSQQNFSAYSNGEGISTGFTLQQNSNCKISVVDVLGNVLYSENLGLLAEGTYSEVIETATLSSGVYFVKLETGESLLAKKVFVQK